METTIKASEVRTSDEMASKLRDINENLKRDGENLFFDRLPKEVLRITKRAEVCISFFSSCIE